MKYFITFFCLCSIFLAPLVFAEVNPIAVAIDMMDNHDEMIQRELAKHRFQLKHSAEYYYSIGLKLQGSKQLKEAVKNYEYAILINPEYSLPYFSLGEIYYQLGLYTESISYIQRSLKKKFEFEFDKIKANYLLSIVYFKIQESSNALDILMQLANDYQTNIDRQAINGLNVKYEYYAPAFLLLSVYYWNQHTIDKHIDILQKALQLGFKKEYLNYFFYEYYLSKNLDSIAWEYLNQAKDIDPQIEEHIKTTSWLNDYDIYADIIKN